MTGGLGRGKRVDVDLKGYVETPGQPTKGLLHSAALTSVERLHLDAAGQRLVVEIDLKDPDYFTQPFNRSTKMVLAVSDLAGNVVGLYREPDATIFSIDVAVSKSRNVEYYNNPAQLQPIDQLPNVLPGIALTARSFRYLALPRFPEGIDGTPPGPFSILNDPGSNRYNALNQGPPPPALWALPT